MRKELLRIENIKKGTLLKRVELQVFEGEIIHCVFDNIQAKKLFFETAGLGKGHITGAEKLHRSDFHGQQADSLCHN